jgi:RNA polymerase sigma-70 factor (ECF subfamily)
LEDSLLNNEKILLCRIAGGDENAFRVIYNQYHNKVYNKAFALTRDMAVAEDTIQEIFIKLWINREKIAEINDLNAYLNVLIRNHIYNYFRKLAYHEKYIEHFLLHENQADKNSSDIVIYNELHNKILKAVSLLPPQQKRVYELSRSEGLKLTEIARQLNLSRETVKKHIAEALRKIKNHLKEYKQLITFLTMFRNF